MNNSPMGEAAYLTLRGMGVEIEGLKESYRVLADKGILIFKCQDKISSGKQYMSHCFVHDEAVKIGFYPKDMFVLLAKNRLVADWQLKNQKNARKFHSYFWVFEKINKKILYCYNARFKVKIK